MGNGVDLGGGQGWVRWMEELKPLQSVQNCQTKTHVHKNGHDERYKCIDMQCHDIDNQGKRSCNQKTHMKRNENLIYDCYWDTKRKSRDTQKYVKNDNQETVEIDNQTGIYL